MKKAIVKLKYRCPKCGDSVVLGTCSKVTFNKKVLNVATEIPQLSITCYKGCGKGKQYPTSFSGTLELKNIFKKK